MRPIWQVLTLFMAAAMGTLAPAAFAQQATAENPITLRKADFGIATQTRTELSMWWASELERRSGDRVKVEFFPANTLVTAADIFESTRAGVIDIGIWVQAYNPAVSPMSDLFTLPGISPEFRPAVLAANDLVLDGDFPYFRDELRQLGVEPIYVWGVSDQEFIGTRPLGRLSALKGLKIRVIGREWPKLVNQFGATPVAMPWPEVYEALMRGTLDANVGFVTANRDSKLYEPAKYHTRIRLGAPAGQLAIMNQAAWDNLPEDIQAIIRDLGREFPGRLADLYEAELADAIAEMESKGVTFYEWPHADRDQLQVAMESLWQDWANGLEARGLPALDMMQRYRALQAEYTK